MPQGRFLVPVRIAVGKFLHLGPAGVKLQVMLFGKADGPVTLMRQVANPLIGAADPGFSHGHFPLGRLSRGYFPSRLIGNVAAALHIRRHIGAMVLDGLESSHRPAELRALLGVFHGHFQHRFRAAQHFQTLAGHRPLQSPLDKGPPPIYCAQNGIGRRLHPLQDNLALAVGGYGRQRVDGQAGGVGRDQEQGYALGRVGGFGSAGGDQQQVGGMGLGDKEFGPVDAESAALPGGGSGNSPGFISSAGLGQSQGQQQLAAAQAGQDFLFLRGGAGVQDGEAAEDDGGEKGAGQQGAAGFLEEDGQVQKIAAGAAVLFGKGYPRPAQAGQLPPQLRGIAAFLRLHFPHQGQGTFLGQKLPGAVLEHLLNFAQPQIHLPTPAAAPKRPARR